MTHSALILLLTLLAVIVVVALQNAVQLFLMCRGITPAAGVRVGMLVGLAVAPCPIPRVPIDDHRVSGPIESGSTQSPSPRAKTSGDWNARGIGDSSTTKDRTGSPGGEHDRRVVNGHIPESGTL